MSVNSLCGSLIQRLDALTGLVEFQSSNLGMSAPVVKTMKAGISPPGVLYTVKKRWPMGT